MSFDTAPSRRKARDQKKVVNIKKDEGVRLESDKKGHLRLNPLASRWTRRHHRRSTFCKQLRIVGLILEPQSYETSAFQSHCHTTIEAHSLYTSIPLASSLAAYRQHVLHTLQRANTTKTFCCKGQISGRRYGHEERQ